jgi:hypothetical protein
MPNHPKAELCKYCRLQGILQECERNTRARWREQIRIYREIFEEGQSASGQKEDQ